MLYCIAYARLHVSSGPLGTPTHSANPRLRLVAPPTLQKSGAEPSTVQYISYAQYDIISSTRALTTTEQHPESTIICTYYRYCILVFLCRCVTGLSSAASWSSRMAFLGDASLVARAAGGRGSMVPSYVYVQVRFRGEGRRGRGREMHALVWTPPYYRDGVLLRGQKSVFDALRSSRCRWFVAAVLCDAPAAFTPVFHVFLPPCLMPYFLRAGCVGCLGVCLCSVCGTVCALHATCGASARA